MKKISEVYKKLSYRKKVFAGMLVSAIIPILICSFGVLISFRLSNEAKLRAQGENTLSQTNDKLEKTCSTIKEALRHIANAPSTLRMLTEDNEFDESDVVYRLLYSSAMGNSRYADYALYDKNGNLVLYAGDSTNIKDNISVNWGIFYELAKDTDSVRARCGRLYSGSDKNTLLRIGCAVKNKDGSVAGFVIAQITENSFTDLLGNIDPDGTGAIYLIDDFGETFFSSQAPEHDEFVKALNTLAEDNRAAYLSADGDSRYYYIKNSANEIQILYRQHIEPYKVMNRGLIVCLSFAGLAGLFISLFTSKSLSTMFYRPIHRMTKAMEKVKQGDFEARVKVDSEDELGHLSETFNEMSAKLTENMEELVNREKELSDANIKMMQAQLNPHFIYNTLDTMKWIGKDNEIPEVATLSSGLAAILRTSISSGQTVSLKKEVELVENYAAIQQVRFADKFIFLTDIPEELMKCEVPKLILQPVVENSIIHGFEGRDYGQVLVTGHREDDKLILVVKDDGTGVTDEIIEKLNNHEQLARGSNIGFHNVDSIIRLHYGADFGLVMQRGENGGTEVVYTLPYKTIGE